MPGTSVRLPLTEGEVYPFHSSQVREAEVQIPTFVACPFFQSGFLFHSVREPRAPLLRAPGLFLKFPPFDPSTRALGRIFIFFNWCPGSFSNLFNFKIPWISNFQQKPLAGKSPSGHGPRSAHPATFFPHRLAISLFRAGSSALNSLPPYLV